jgi:hypothetical protein
MAIRISASGQLETLALQQNTQLFDHLVGAIEQRLRDRETKCFRGLEVDDQLDLRGLQDRQFGTEVAGCRLGVAQHLLGIGVGRISAAPAALVTIAVQVNPYTRPGSVPIGNRRARFREFGGLRDHSRRTLKILKRRLGSLRKPFRCDSDQLL